MLLVAYLAYRRIKKPWQAGTWVLTTARVRILAGASEKVASDFALGGGFHPVLQFPPPLATGFS